MLIFLEQFLYARESFGAGPTIYVEAAELVDRGVNSILVEAIRGIGLEVNAVTWQQTEDGVQAARQLVQASAQELRGKNDA
jgi:hypothetical protein